MLEKIGQNKKSIGIKQSEKSVREGLASLVFIAKDAESRIVCNIRDECEKKSVLICDDYTMQELGRACEIDVFAAVVAILK